MSAREQIMTRAVNFIAGAARTGDIETIRLGAHGPCRVPPIPVEGNL